MSSSSFNTLLNEIAEDLREARLAAGLSQEALALIAEVDRTYVSQLERGVSNPSIAILIRLADALGVRLRLKFERNEHPARTAAKR